MFRSLLLLALISSFGFGCVAQNAPSSEESPESDVWSGDVALVEDAKLDVPPPLETSPVDVDLEVTGDATPIQDGATADQESQEDADSTQDVTDTSDSVLAADVEVVSDAPTSDAQEVSSGADGATAPKDVEQEDSPSLEDVTPDATPDVTQDVTEPEPLGECCEAHSGTGCATDACSQAVCALDDYCCETKWDGYCVSCAQGLETYSGQSCAGLQGICGCEVPEPEPLPLGECCEVHSGVGCAADACSQAVCALDDYCCETKWDVYCVGCAQGLETYGGQSCAGLQGLCGCEVPEPEPVSHVELAEHWAPVWFHDTDDTHYEADYIVAYDFDSDTISSNNWENLDEAFVDLGAVIYYAVIETSSHWFIYYLDFHPRDWTEDCDPLIWWVEPCHENDLEGAMVVIRKDGTEHGTFEVLYTEAHNYLHIATNDPNITAASTSNLEDVPVTFEEGSHVQLYVESKGHGVCPLYYDGDSHCEHPTDGSPPAFPGGDGIVYRYDDGEAEQPSSGSDPNVSYKLVSFYDTLWKRRYDICDGACTYDQTMPYAGTLLGETFDGDTWGEDKARPPWSWDDPDDGPVYKGDWFFDPAQTLVTHLSVPGEVSFEYVHNPYLDELWPVGAP